jgi:ATP-dependent DNA ligase
MKPLYSRTSTGAINVWKAWTEGAEVVVEWGQLNGAYQQSRFTALEKNAGKKNATTAEQQAEKEVAALYVKQLRKKYSETLEEAVTSEAIKPMLAKTFEDHKSKVKWPAYGQVKLDGLRAMAYLKDGKAVLHSRGNKFYTLPHIQKQLEGILTPGMILDGELYTHGTSLQTINSYVRGQKPECATINYNVYDVVSDKPFWGRLNDLNGLPTAQNVLKVETFTLMSEEDAVVYQAQCVGEGYEGAMIRSAAGLYRYGHRSADLLKMKTWQTEEFPILGHKVGKGKFEDVPMIVCGLPNGQTFDVTPTGTMAERRELLEGIESHIGKLYTVKFFNYSPKNVPLYPTGVGIRDKSDL